MKKRVAIVADALSSDYIFRFFIDYYGSQFGAKSIYIVTYAGLSSAFDRSSLGGVIELPAGYDDETRKNFIGNFVSACLASYDVVIRVDIDEFLVADPHRFESLRHFVNEMETPYVTARGFDVVQLSDEPPLPVELNAPLLAKREFAYPNAALNKTCITTIPLKWSAGFHSASVFPRFNSLFMLHTKRIDIGWQLRWFGEMSRNIQNSPSVSAALKDYYTPDEAKIRAYHRGVDMRPRLNAFEAWFRTEFIQHYLDKVQFSERDGLYHGNFDHELVLCRIPDQWKSLIR